MPPVGFIQRLLAVSEGPTDAINAIPFLSRADFFARLITVSRSDYNPTGWDVLDEGKDKTEIIPGLRAIEPDAKCRVWTRLGHELKNMTTVRLHAQLPLFTAAAPISIINEALASVVAAIHVNHMGPTTGHIPVVDAGHNKEQNTWLRKSKATGKPLPLCRYANNRCAGVDMCASLMYRHSHGPLHVQLTPTEQREWDAGRFEPPERMCIQCEQRNMRALIEQHGMTADAQMQYRGVRVFPLTCPLVNTVGGYNEDAVYLSGPIVPVPVIRDIPLTVAMDEQGRPYFNEGSAVFGVQAPLN